MPATTLPRLGCYLQSAVLNLCLTDEDLRGLGHWQPGPNPRGYTPRLWSRIELHRACVHVEGVAERLEASLDLRFVEPIFAVREADPQDLPGLVSDLDQAGPSLAGLLWALLSDPRPEVHHLGVRLAHECVSYACIELVRADDAAAEPRSEASG